MAKVVKYGDKKILKKYGCIQGTCPRCESEIVFHSKDWTEFWINGLDFIRIAYCPCCGLELKEDFTSSAYRPKPLTPEEQERKDILEYCNFDKEKFIEAFAKISRDGFEDEDGNDIFDGIGHTHPKNSWGYIICNSYRSCEEELALLVWKGIKAQTEDHEKEIDEILGDI